MPIIFHRDRVTANPRPGVERMVVADREDGTGAISMLVAVLAPGAAILPHTHLVEEAFTVLEGDVRVLLDDETHELLGGGVTVVAPANTAHAVRNIGSVPVRIVAAYPSVNVTMTRVNREF